MNLMHTRFTLLGLNPNDVATFLVIMVLSLPILLTHSKRWLWAVFPLEILLLALLVGTGSRGGMVALVCGSFAGAMGLWRSGSWPKGFNVWLGLGLGIFLGVGAGLAAFPQGSRLGQVDISQDASMGRRLEVWSTVPAMMASAPGGWGMGQSADAYEQWFEPAGERVHLKHLLSSHLTWLVEMGWPFRWLYLTLWFSALIILFAGGRSRLSAVVGALWIAFFVALIFNASGKWWNWPVPLFWLLIVLIQQGKKRSFPSGRRFIAAGLASAAVVAAPFLWYAFATPPSPVHAYDGGNIVWLGNGKPATAILSPSKDVLGNFYGQELRQSFSSSNRTNGSVVVISRPDQAAAAYVRSCRLYVISGGDETALYQWRLVFTPEFESKLLLINTRVQPDAWVKVFSRVVYCHGDFFGDRYYEEWKTLSGSNPSLSIKNLPRCGAYVANFWQLLNDLQPQAERVANTKLGSRTILSQ